MVDAFKNFALEDADNSEGGVAEELMSQFKDLEQLVEPGSDSDVEDANEIKVGIVEKAILRMMELSGVQPQKIQKMSEQLPHYLNMHLRFLSDLSKVAARSSIGEFTLQLRGICTHYMGYLRSSTAPAPRATPRTAGADTAPRKEVLNVKDRARARMESSGLELDSETLSKLGVQSPGIQRIPERGNPRAMWQRGKQPGAEESAA
jgi:hypothetical protein